MHLPEDIKMDLTRQGVTCKTLESEESIWLNAFAKKEKHFTKKKRTILVLHSVGIRQ